MEFTYKGLEAQTNAYTVSGEEVERQLQRLLQQNPRITPIIDRPTRSGDEVVLDYAGFCEGVQFPGGTAEMQTLVLGSHTFIPGFEEQLIGYMPGDEVSVKVMFPTEYHAPDLAGKAAEFRCKIHQIRETSEYAMDDVFAMEIGGVATFAEMKEQYAKAFQDYADNQSEMELQDNLLREAAKTIEYVPADAEIEAEIKENSELFYEIEPIDTEAHVETARNCLAVRKFIENNSLDAFTINFRKIGGDSGITAMPFIEACKAMARGTGYAGEGDILTASLVGALLKTYEGATFAEIFCPDWKNNSLLISHMGEYNLALVKGKPGMKKINFIYGENTLDPVVSYGCYRAGEAVFINLFKAEDGYKLLISPIEMLDVPERAFEFKVRGWFTPRTMSIDSFLEDLSRAGATHHSAIIYGSTVREMEFFASILGLPTVCVL